MAWPYTKREITDALVSKFAFAQDDRDHDYYLLELDGRSVAYTYVSHGTRDRVTPKIAYRMMQEMRLQTLQQFRDAIDCPLSQDDYYALLRGQRVDPEVAAGAARELEEPTQPTRWLWTVTGRSFGYVQNAALYTHDGRNVGRLVGGDEEIYALDGSYLGEIKNYNTLVTVAEKRDWSEDRCEPERRLKPVEPWAGRLPLPIEDGEEDFPHPDAL